jgi:hypothetical protein
MRPWPLGHRCLRREQKCDPPLDEVETELSFLPGFEAEEDDPGPGPGPGGKQGRDTKDGPLLSDYRTDAGPRRRHPLKALVAL